MTLSNRTPTNITGNANPNVDLVLGPSEISGSGVFAGKDFEKNQTLGYFEGFPTNQDTKHSLTFDAGKIEPSGVLRHLNHSCDPNSHFVGRWLVALREIPKGTEVCIDYRATEETISNHFVCNCRAAKCRGRV
jgi:hypothetical protein